MKQPVTASADDPLGDPTPGVQGCDFNGAGVAYATIIYFQTGAAFVYDSLHSTAEANGVRAVPGLGDRAFIYVGAMDRVWWWPKVKNSSASNSNVSAADQRKTPAC